MALLPDTPPAHGFFLKCGRLEIGIVGIPALLVLAFAVAVAFAGRLLNAW